MTAIMLKAHPAAHKKVVSRSGVVCRVIYFSRSQKKRFWDEHKKNCGEKKGRRLNLTVLLLS